MNKGETQVSGLTRAWATALRASDGDLAGAIRLLKAAIELVAKGGK